MKRLRLNLKWLFKATTQPKGNTKLNSEFSPFNNIPQESQFGKWHVSITGDLSYDGDKYNIYEQQLEDNRDWLIHMMGKQFVDWNEFMPAYLQALKNANIQLRMERIYYKFKQKPQNA